MESWTKAKPAYPTPMEMVEFFYKTLGNKPEVPMASILIIEEWEEWVESTSDEEELKELADLIYVLYGYALAKGWDLDEALYRVHANNVGRMRQPDGSIQRRADGKVIKNPNHPKVDLRDLL